MVQLHRRTFGALALGTAVVGVAGCSSVDPNAGSGASAKTGSTSATGGAAGNNSSAGGSATPGDPSASSTPTVPAPTATLTTPKGLTAMLPTDSLTVSVANGTLVALDVATAAGKPVEGTLTGNTWKPTRFLLPQTKYVATVTMKDSAGTQSTQKINFNTLTTTVASYQILYDGNTLGVGAPAIIQFASAVEGKARKAEVQKHVSIEMNKKQEGAWGWLTDTQLMWRPKSYWQPGTTVKVIANLAGVQTGPNKWVGRDGTGSFTIGDARISYVNIATDQMRVTKNGQTVRTIPVTTGRQPNYTTRSGTKVIIERDSSVVMDSTTVDIPKGSPDAYHLNVKWAMRLTWSGEFLHAAPWSVGSQGHSNVSHGCTGMSTADAEWLFNFSRVGDVVIYTGSNRPMTPDNGYGMWNLSYDQWKATSAL